MGKKLGKRKKLRWSRASNKVQNRKFNPPSFGITETLQEQNRTVLNAIAAKLGVK